VVRRNKAHVRLHPLLAELGSFTALDAVPVAVLVLDRRGEVVYRNAEALALAQRVSAEHGAAILVLLRERLQQIAVSECSFPVCRVVEVHEAGHHAEAEMIVSRPSETAFVAYWRDITGERDTARASRAVAGELGATAQAFAELGERLLAAAGAVSARSAQVAAGSEEMSAGIHDIAASAAAAVTATDAAVRSAEQASVRLGKLADSSARIGAVSKLITGIAEQTNLLALNATIEAARAGEAGKGFAVVAGEVKDLAARTARATGEIAHMIEEIRRDSTDAEAAIAEITRGVAQIQQQQTTVAGAVEQQTATSQEISSSMAAVADAATSTAASAQELRQHAERISESSMHLRTLFT